MVSVFTSNWNKRTEFVGDVLSRWRNLCGSECQGAYISDIYRHGARGQAEEIQALVIPLGAFVGRRGGQIV